MVVPEGLPAGFLDDLPLEEQFSISEMVGKPVKFCGISSGIFRKIGWERAELAFSNRELGMNHTLYVDPSLIRPLK